jgi:hypothetical protein
MQNGGLFLTSTDHTELKPGLRTNGYSETPNEIIIWGEATSGSKLRRALASPELKAAMKEAGGVAGTLKLHVIPYSSDAVIA